MKEIRICNVCRKHLELEMFGFQSKKDNKRGWTCYPCGKKISANRRKRTKEFVEKNRLAGEQTRETVLRIGLLPSLEELFKRCTTNDKGCRLWKGAKANGYGQYAVKLGKDLSPVTMPAHRVSYFIKNKSISSYKSNKRNNLVIDHLCSERSCINPEHLEQVPQSENVRRAFDYHCPGCRCH